MVIVSSLPKASNVLTVVVSSREEGRRVCGGEGEGGGYESEPCEDMADGQFPQSSFSVNRSF